MSDPIQALSQAQQQAQKRALSLLGDAFDGLMATAGGAVKMGTTAVTEPTEALNKLVEVMAALGDLAATTTVPMQNLLASQRNLANAMQSFADLQKELGEVVEKIAVSHGAVLDALEGLAKPVVVAGQVMTGTVPEKPKKGGKSG